MGEKPAFAVVKQLMTATVPKPAAPTNLLVNSIPGNPGKVTLSRSH